MTTKIRRRHSAEFTFRVALEADKEPKTTCELGSRVCYPPKSDQLAALVYDGPTAVGWCQFGPTDELPRIKHRRAYLNALTTLPDWRITCFFVDREYRGKGVAAIALVGALNEIARMGGGIVESYPEDTEGRSVSGSFLHNGTISIFERLGFQRTRKLGKNHWVVARVIDSRP